ncbi:MAG: hypothetical protein ACYC3I_13200 [Gemmataceae bacterium]
MIARILIAAVLLWTAGVSVARGQEQACFAPALPEQECPQETPPPSALLAPNAEGIAPPCPPQPADPCSDPVFPIREEVFTHRGYCPEVWGFAGFNAFASGNKMAPNGQTYYPLGSLFIDFNIGILPEKKLYVFSQGVFWAQKPTSGVTNGSQGNFDFSKREMDLSIGAAWRYYGPLEVRVFAYSYNNLNRGFNLNVPEGYNDGVGIENRYYIFKSNAYDLPRLNFLSLGYMPTKEITGGDGLLFKPGLFARAYLTYEFVPRKYYVYADTELLCQQYVTPRLLFFDDGFAARPFDKLPGLEFRLGVFNTGDVQVDNLRTLVYGSILVLF